MISHASTSFLESPNRFAEHLRAAIKAAPLRDLDGLSSKLWDAYRAGIVGDDHAQQLQELIQQRRGGHIAVDNIKRFPSTGRYLIQRSPEQRSPDRRASLLRRRKHSATGPLPPHLAAGFTTGELAVLK